MVLESFDELLEQIAHHPWNSLGVVVNIILIETLLSIDNAAVLATMVMEVPKDQRPKALKYGIVGAYVFRGICLFFAAVLITIWWFKPLGGLYLLFLALRYLMRRKKKKHLGIPEELLEPKQSWLYRKTLGALGLFWGTVVMVELMDLAFSIDNVIAANAYSRNIILIWSGVFIGILAMRFVAQGFVKLLERYPFLEVCAYIVIFLLGLKLSLTLITHFYPCSSFALFVDGPNECLMHQGRPIPEGEHPMIWGDILTSTISLAVFFVPILTSLLFNWPKHHFEKRKRRGD